MSLSPAEMKRLNIPPTPGLESPSQVPSREAKRGKGHRHRGNRGNGNHAHKARYRAHKLQRTLCSGQQPVTVASSAAAGIGDVGFSSVSVPDLPGEHSGSSASSTAPSALQLSVACPFDRIREWQRRSVTSNGGIVPRLHRIQVSRSSGTVPHGPTVSEIVAARRSSQ